MSENIIATAENYSCELDRVFTAKSVTAFFADNALRTKFVGSKTVMIPDVNFDGLSDYDRKTGFEDGAVSVVHNAYTMSMDRARSLTIDREDMDEAGIASLAGKVLGEYVRTKVVPECDAYVISKIAQAAKRRGNVLTDASLDAPYSAFLELVGNVQQVAGYDEEIVCFVDSKAYAALCASDEISRMMVTTDFKQGELNLSVKSINGVAIIPVVSERMRTLYNFKEGGFEPCSGVTQIFMLALPKSAAHLVKKTEKMRIFTPEQNSTADAYKFDYRIYYDVFIKETAADAIWLWESIAIDALGVGNDISAPQGSTELCMQVHIDSENADKAKFQWYQCDDKYGRGARKIDETSMEYRGVSNFPKGTYYFFCDIIIDGVTTIRSNVMTAEVI